MVVAGQRQARLWTFLETGLFGELGVPALVVSLVLFVSAMTLLGANVSELRSGYARMQQTNAALLQIATVNTDILRVEMTVRGYTLSGDPSYLSWLKKTNDGLQKRLVMLDKLAGDDPDERADAVMLKKLLDAHATYFERMAQMALTDRDRVVTEMVDYSKKVKRRPIENLLTDMRNDETRRLSEQQHDAETRVVNAYRDALAISLLALLLGAIGFALVIHDRRIGRNRT